MYKMLKLKNLHGETFVSQIVCLDCTQYYVLERILFNLAKYFEYLFSTI